MKHLTLLSGLSSLILLTPSVLAQPLLTLAAETTSRDFPIENNQPLVIPISKGNYQLTVSNTSGPCTEQTFKKVKFNKPIVLNCSQQTTLPLKIRFSGDYAFHYDESHNTLLFKREPKKSTKTTFKRPIPKVECQRFSPGEKSIYIGDTFESGAQLKEVFSNQVVRVDNGYVKITPSASNGGLVLLEPVVDQPIERTELDYRNANIYFIMVDRFHAHNAASTQPYLRQKDGMQEIGTFHGGNLKGIIDKLDYIKELGTNVIWLSPIVEQVHGFVGGGDSGSFPFYGYHGYWARDFTKIDQSFGDDADLKLLVEEAHKRGLKILLDAVINHPGYSTLADAQFDQLPITKQPNTLPTSWASWSPSKQENWHSYHEQIDYSSAQWDNWWGPDWVRTGLPNYDKPGSSDTTLSLAGLPDFKTESSNTVTPPQWLINNPGTRVQARNNYTVADYLVEWQTDWVKRFGIDGYRVDTVKHVESDIWLRLKQEATSSLEQWRASNNQTGQPFWMMGEVWGHGAYRSPYFDDGFDALINFDMQKKLDKGAVCLTEMADTYQQYSQSMHSASDFNPVSYMSSHDTELFFSRFKSHDMQKAAANALLLSPGAVQVYYGDEVGRDIGPYADDFHQGTRSDMLWELSNEKKSLLSHWRTVGQFRDRHPAIGAGKHIEITNDSAYVFSRELDNDKVIVAYFGN